MPLGFVSKFVLMFSLVIQTKVSLSISVANVWVVFTKVCTKLVCVLWWERDFWDGFGFTRVIRNLQKCAITWHQHLQGIGWSLNGLIIAFRDIMAMLQRCWSFHEWVTQNTVWWEQQDYWRYVLLELLDQLLLESLLFLGRFDKLEQSVILLLGLFDGILSINEFLHKFCVVFIIWTTALKSFHRMRYIIKFGTKLQKSRNFKEDFKLQYVYVA